jgi:hypothetical protein
MHWRTYRRLRNEAKAAKAEADYLLAESLPGLAQLLDLLPPRQNGGAGAAMAGQSLLRPRIDANIIYSIRGVAP